MFWVGPGRGRFGARCCLLAVSHTRKAGGDFTCACGCVCQHVGCSVCLREWLEAQEQRADSRRVRVLPCMCVWCCCCCCRPAAKFTKRGHIVLRVRCVTREWTPPAPPGYHAIMLQPSYLPSSSADRWVLWWAHRVAGGQVRGVQQGTLFHACVAVTYSCPSLCMPACFGGVCGP